MAASPTPKSVATTGNLLITWIPGTTSNPLSVAILTAGTSKDLTFSFISGGLTPAINENSIPDSRLGARQVLNQLGNFTEELSGEYIYGDTNDIAAPALTLNTQGFLVWRYGVPNETAYATGQKAHVWTVSCGTQQPQPPAENALLTIKQNFYIIAPTQRFQTLVA